MIGASAGREPLRGAARGEARRRWSAASRRSTLLLAAGSRPTSGEGQVVLLSGEPGIGKSRLAAGAARAARAASRISRLRYYCSPYHANSALYPGHRRSSSARPTSHRDDDREREARTSSRPCSRSDATSTESLPLLAELLSIPAGDRYPPLSLSPQRARRRPRRRCSAQLDGLARAAAGADGLRGRALDRSDLARAAGADASSASQRCRCCCSSLPARVRAALGRPRHMSPCSRSTV